MDPPTLKELSPSSSHNSQGNRFRFIRIVVKVELYKQSRQIHLKVLPVRDSPGVDAAHSLVRRGAQVGLVLSSVLPDVFQRAAWHGDNSRPAFPRRAWERQAASVLLLILGCFLWQAAV